MTAGIIWSPLCAWLTDKQFTYILLFRSYKKLMSLLERHIISIFRRPGAYSLCLVPSGPNRWMFDIIFSYLLGHLPIRKLNNDLCSSYKKAEHSGPLLFQKLLCIGLEASLTWTFAVAWGHSFGMQTRNIHFQLLTPFIFLIYLFLPWFLSDILILVPN